MNLRRNKKGKGQISEDVLLKLKEDRRLLSNVPDKTNVRTNADRRGKTYDSSNINEYIAQKQSGLRYKVDYDVEVICVSGKKKKSMYHDQGQIALKLKGFDQGITIAGGLPAPIVTCAHGTAYDIAGKGLAKTSAFENAVKMAAKMARTIKNMD